MSQQVLETAPSTTSRLQAFRQSLTRRDRRGLAGMAAFIVLLHVLGFGVLLALVAPRNYHLGGGHPVFTVGVGVLAYTFGLRHAFDADHIAAVDNTTRKLIGRQPRPRGRRRRPQDASRCRSGFWFSLGHSTIVFAARVPALGRREGAGRPGRGRQLDAALGHRRDRRLGLRHLPVDPGHPQPRRPCSGILKVFREMRTGHVRRGRAGGAAEQARLHEPLPRRPDQVDPQALAHLPDRRPVRPRLRHRDRGRPARAGRRRCGVQPALLLDPGAADPVRGRHVPDGHRRRRLHERRVRVGVRAAGPQGLLQPHHHLDLGRWSPWSSAPSSSSASSPTGSRSHRPARGHRRHQPRLRGLRHRRAVRRLLGGRRSVVWRFGRIEERWSADLGP